MTSRLTITRLPLEQLPGIEAHRERVLSKEAVRNILRHGPVEFIVAEVGRPLRHVEVDKCYEFWKSEAEVHVVADPDAGFRLEEFPGEYAYVASEWSGQGRTPIVLLEKHH